MLSTLTVQPQAKVIAHRGFSGIAPENTLVSFQKAIDLGIEYIELDVHKTADDSLVVIHDYTVDRISSNGMKGKVSDMTYAQLRAVKAGYSRVFGAQYENEKIPTLREVLNLAKGRIKVCIEIKVPGIEEEVLDLVNYFAMHDDVIIFSFYGEVLLKVRQLDPAIKLLYLINYVDEGTIDHAKSISANAIGVNKDSRVPVELIALAHRQGVEIWVWTVDEEDDMHQLASDGIDGLITNFPDRAMKIVKSE
jgi:glycerophosphoryl diester phosphodiesterase